jgi:hypothetical protein
MVRANVTAGTALFTGSYACGERSRRSLKGYT